MNITSAKYTKDDFNIKNIKATVDGQEMFIPIKATDNRHWIAIHIKLTCICKDSTTATIKSKI